MGIEIQGFFIAKPHNKDGRTTSRGCMTMQWCTTPSHVEEIVVEFYQALFISQNPENFEEILAQIPQVVTEEVNNELIVEFQKEKVETALKQMTHLKSLGSDGMPPIFYQHYWSLVGNDVVEDILWVISLHLYNIHLLL